MSTPVSFKSKAALGAVLIAAVSLFAWTAWRDEGNAETLPGSVPQAASASDAGVAVQITKAVFSAVGVDVWLEIDIADQNLDPAGLAGNDARLAGAEAGSVRIFADGRAILRFPAVAFDESLTLAISAVEVLAEDGTKQRLPGQWELPVVQPPADERATIAELKVLGPAEADLGGHTITLEGFRTASATVIRYEMAAALTQAALPTLRVGEVTLAPDQVTSADGVTTEAWFGPTEPGADVTVSLEGLQVAVPEDDAATFSATLGTFDPPTQPDSATHDIPWSDNESPTGYEILGIGWVANPGQPSIQLRIEGIWDPARGGRPEVIADGTALQVTGTGLYPKPTEGAPFTTVEALIEGDAPPTEIAVVIGGITTSVDAVEVTLTE